MDYLCNGLRPEFGKGTPEIYKKLAYRFMNANPDQRPAANDLYDILYFGIILSEMKTTKVIKNLVIKENKSNLYLKKLIK